MAYSKVLAKKYATNRDRYRSSDNLLTPLLKKAGIKGKVILDFGCGDGPEAARFISMGSNKVVGIDPSAEMVRLAKERKLSNATFLKNNGKNIPSKNNQFDLVYARFVLHYIKDLEPQFVEIHRVLKKGGYFLAIFQAITNNSKLLNKQVPFNLGIGKGITKIKIFSKSTDEVRLALKEAKLKVVKFIEVKNEDAHIDPKYKNIYKFKNATYILFARKS
jgi:ubiquinone/menaquinone biosynthesis C-methylase UbiE